MFCKHEWEIIDKEILSPPIERIKDLVEGKARFPYWMFESTYICILQCKKCGKLNKTITKGE